MVDYGVAKIERVASAPVVDSAPAQTVDPSALADAVLYRTTRVVTWAQPR